MEVPKFVLGDKIDDSTCHRNVFECWAVQNGPAKVETDETQESRYLAYEYRKHKLGDFQILKREVEKIRSLNCDEIVEYVDTLEWNCSQDFNRKNLYVVVKEFQGQTTLNERQFTLQESINIYQQLVDIVKFLHDNNISHKNISISNVKVSREGKVKLGRLEFNQYGDTFNTEEQYRNRDWMSILIIFYQLLNPKSKNINSMDIIRDLEEKRMQACSVKKEGYIIKQAVFNTNIKTNLQVEISYLSILYNYKLSLCASSLWIMMQLRVINHSHLRLDMRQIDDNMLQQFQYVTFPGLQELSIKDFDGNVQNLAFIFRNATPKLQSLYFNNCNVSSVSLLQTMKQFKIEKFIFTQFPLIVKIKLQHLTIHWSKKSVELQMDGPQPTSLQSLTELSVCGNNAIQIESLILPIISNVLILNLSMNGIGNATPVFQANLKKLKELRLGDNLIEDVSGLQKSEFLELTDLRLEKNHISSIEVFKRCKLPKLKMLNLENNRINSIACLEKCQFTAIEKYEFRKKVLIQQYSQFYNFEFILKHRRGNKGRILALYLDQISLNRKKEQKRRSEIQKMGFSLW